MRTKIRSNEMRGADVMQEELFTLGGLDQYIPADHPLRRVRDVFNACLLRMDTHFGGLYSPFGRVSIAPEKLLRALMLQVLFGIRSERQLVEQLRYNMLYRWFVGLPLHEQPWDHSSFTKNRERLLEGGTPEVLFEQVLDCARAEHLLSDEHFSVDGTMIRAWASQASFVRKDSSDDEGKGGSFRGQERSNDTHASRTDPDARLFKKSQGSEAHLAYLGHALTENRHGFAVAGTLTLANGSAEREAALALMDKTAEPSPEPARTKRRTLGADKNYDTADFVAQCRERDITAHVAQNTRRCGGSAIDARTSRHAGYEISQIKRQMAERVHAWPKTWSTMRRAMVRGLDRMKAHYQLALTGGNLVRLVNLMG
jgi:transposase